MKKRLLTAIENHSRISTEDLAAICCTSVSEIEKTLEALEAEKVICGYHTLINWDKIGEEKADALIEVKVTPQKGVGFDQMAETIYKFPEVTNMYLISGNCDFVLFVQGRSMREIAMFVSEQLSTIDGVLSTTTQFILKKYKQDGFTVEGSSKDKRLEMV